jgi:hypothetical protein
MGPRTSACAPWNALQLLFQTLSALRGMIPQVGRHRHANGHAAEYGGPRRKRPAVHAGWSGSWRAVCARELEPACNLQALTNTRCNPTTADRRQHLLPLGWVPAGRLLCAY